MKVSVEEEEKQVAFHINYNSMSSEPEITILKGNSIHSTCRGIKKALELVFELGLQIGKRSKMRR
jgi:hypothetical protein